MSSTYCTNYIYQAFAEELHEKVRKDYWSYSPEECLQASELHKIHYKVSVMYLVKVWTRSEKKRICKLVLQAPFWEICYLCFHLLFWQGVRPAPGYPSQPDHTEKQTLWNILHVKENCGIELTDSLAMKPAAAVCGLYFAHPKSEYFSVGKLCQDQVSVPICTYSVLTSCMLS